MPAKNTFSGRDAGAFLEKTSGVGRGKIFELSANRMSVGRTIDNDIVLNSDHVSRCHAHFIKNKAAWFVQDNQSKNGVIVNGVPVTEKRLIPGDIVQIGDHVFRFNHPVVEAQTTDSDHPRSSYSVRDEISAFNAAVAAQGALILKEPNRAPLYSVAIAILSGVIYFVTAFSSHSDERAVGLFSRLATKASALVRREDGDDGETDAESVTFGKLPDKSAALQKTLSSKPEGVTAAKKKPVRDSVADSRSTSSVLPNKLTASEVAKLDDKQELEIYLGEGRNFLGKSDFQSAASAFQIALVIDPQNITAMKGLRAAEYKTQNLEMISLDSLPAPLKPKVSRTEIRRQQRERKREVNELLAKAAAAMKRKSYSEAISLAEAARKIEVRGDTRYLNEAKQTIDRSRQLQKEQFDPFVLEAKAKYDAGDYAASRDLCEEMLRRDPVYKEAQDCAARARERLTKRVSQASRGGTGSRSTEDGDEP